MKQIIYRCDDEIGQALTDTATEKGISRNALMNQICRRFLKKSERKSIKSDTETARTAAKSTIISDVNDAMMDVMDAVLDMRTIADDTEKPAGVRQKIEQLGDEIIARLDEISRKLNRL